MSVEIVLRLNGADVPVTLDAAALAAIADAVAETNGSRPDPAPVSPYMTVVEAAEHLRCSRQRIDDLCSQRRLTRVKEGARTLVRRDEIESYLQGGRSQGRRRTAS